MEHTFQFDNSESISEDSMFTITTIKDITTVVEILDEIVESFLKGRILYS